MSYRPYKFLIISVVQEVEDESGEVINELVQENPTAVFNVDGLRKYADNFEAEMSARIAELNGRGSGIVVPQQGIVRP